MRRISVVGCLFLAASALAFAAADQELLALVPPGARVVTSVDVSQAKNSQFGQYLLSRMNAQDRSFEELIQQTGFDPRRDLQDFVFASAGPPNSGADSNFVVLVRGTFDQNHIRAMAKTKGASIENYRGVDLFIDKSDHRPTAFAFVDTSIAVMGDRATVQQILANRAHPTPLDPGLQQLVSTAAADNDAWFASVMPGSYLADQIKGQTQQPGAEQAIDSIVQSSGGIQFGDVVRLSVDAIARSSKDAQSLADVIRFLGSLAQMSRQKGANAEILAAAVDQMKLQVDGDAVHASISIPEKSLEQLADETAGSSFHSHHLAQH